MNAKITLAGVAEIATPLLRCKRRVLDVGRQDDVRGERADLGSARGPWTEQLSFRPEAPGFAEVSISK